MTIDALANHLWQSTLFALAIGVLALALRRNCARVRYWLWFSASVKFCLPFALLVSVGGHLPWTPAAPPPPPVALSWSVAPFSQPAVAEPLPAVSPVPSPAGSIAPAPGIRVPTATLITLWAAGFLIVVLIRLRLWRQVRAAVRSSRPWHVPGLTPPPDLEVRAVHGLLAPGVAGVWRPVLLVPAGIERQLTPAQLEAVLAHERCHLRQRDHLTASLHMVVEAVFWFHPLVWWIGARLVQEREQACDEEVLRTGSSPRVYAEAILHVCRRYVQIPLANVTGIGRPDVRSRIDAIMDERIGVPLSATWKAALAAATATLVALPLLSGAMLAAQAPEPTFDVASVKVQPEALGPANLGTAIPRVRARGVFSGTHATVESLVRFAYGVQTFQVIGGPDWIRRDTFDIDARAGFDAPAAQIRLMVQSLLEDRFKLVAQTEQRDMRYLALVPAHTNGQPGPYLRRLDDGDCYGRSVGEVYREELPDRALPSARNRLAGACYELRDLAEGLSSLLRTLVIDRTGLGGKWVYDAPYRALPLPPPVSPRLGAPLPVDAGSATEPGLPSFTEALEEYLGLKLESAQGPVDMLVIDSVQQPTEN